ncbi:MAG: TlpA disulfide reductase family protein [Pseudomonadota bacterium]|nr:TlpA disulfide reductase family protein [Pseudomonadota bacterium]
MLLKALTFFFTVLLISVTTCQAADNVERPRLMKKPIPAPSFTLKDMDGNIHKLADYRGQVAVVNFWATWCPPCREEMPSMERAWKQLQKENVAMLAINVGEDADTIFTFTADYPVSFPLLMDQDSSVINAWPVKGLPTTFVLDKQGRIVYRVIGGREWDHPKLIDMLIELQNQ